MNVRINKFVNEFANKLRPLLEDALLVIWLGSFWTVGLLVAPLLFHNLPSDYAATMAGKLFQLSHWIAILSVVVLMACWWRGHKRRLNITLFTLLLLAAVNQGWVMPLVTMLRWGADRDSFVLWHGVSSGIYLLQCIGGLLVLWQRPRAA